MKHAEDPSCCAERDQPFPDIPAGLGKLHFGRMSKSIRLRSTRWSRCTSLELILCLILKDPKVEELTLPSEHDAIDPVDVRRDFGERRRCIEAAVLTLTSDRKNVIEDIAFQHPNLPRHRRSSIQFAGSRNDRHGIPNTNLVRRQVQRTIIRQWFRYHVQFSRPMIIQQRFIRANLGRSSRAVTTRPKLLQLGRIPRPQTSRLEALLEAEFVDVQLQQS